LIINKKSILRHLAVLSSWYPWMNGVYIEKIKSTIERIVKINNVFFADFYFFHKLSPKTLYFFCKSLQMWNF
jgi:hypothetical protein